MFFLFQFISTQNVWLQQIGTDLTQTGSTTPSIIRGFDLLIFIPLVYKEHDHSTNTKITLSIIEYRSASNMYTIS